MFDTFLGFPADEWFEVTTPEQAHLLTQQKSLYHYAPFMGRKIGVAEAAQRAAVSTERMMYWHKKFLVAGLLKEIGIRREGKGRPVRLFTAPHSLRVPFHLTPFEDLSAQLTELGQFYEELRVQATARLRSRSGQLCRLIYRDEEKGTLTIETETDSAVRPIETNCAGVLWLPQSKARELDAQLEVLFQLFETYSIPREGTMPYLFSTALVTLDPHDDAKWLRDFTLPEERETV